MKKFKLFFTPESIKEIKAAADWYNKQQKGLGKRFKGHFKKEADKIKQNPFARSVRYEDVRFAVIAVFPYAIHYTIDEQSATIIVQALLAFKQDSVENWLKRK
ncbi:MAG: type II toxin-antitoxin system RelE/ParE family toxin [Sphingobacteriales bacterium]|nr:type II toxin-antitoxin system RelE/ParE family toxin [Sphingobacteriales bacterium]